MADTRQVTAPVAVTPDPRRWRILYVTLAVGFMTLLDVTIVNVALPSIQEGLDTSAAAVQWVVSGYALTFGLTLVTGGRLGDTLGRRAMMLIGLSGFIVASAAAGLAPTAGVVVAARLVQGAAAGLLTPQNTGLIQELFAGAERGRAFGAFGFTVGVSSAIGPILGGVIIALFGAEHGWRYIFLVNVPIGLVALVFIARMVPGRSQAQRARGLDLDIGGAVLLGLTVLAILFPLVAAVGAAEGVFVVSLLVVPLGWAFVRWERRVVGGGRAPLLDVALLRGTRGYASGLAIGTIYFTGFTGVFLVISVSVQEQYGFTALAAGLLMTPFAVGSAVASPVAGRLVSRIGRRVTVLALSTMLTGTALLILVVPDGGSGRWYLFSLMLLIAGFGGGAVVSPNFTLTLEHVPTAMAGVAGGALQTGQRIGAAIGSALSISVYHNVLERGVSVQAALRVSLTMTCLLVTVALILSVRDLREPSGSAGDARGR